MNIDTKGIISNTRKFVVFLIVNIDRSAWEHPFLLGMVFFLLLLYIFVPYLFGLLVSSSPIIICTALLLGTLLSYGQPNIPEIEQETTHDLSPSQEHAISKDLVVEKDESFSIESHIENIQEFERTATREAKVTERVYHFSKSERGALLSALEGENRKPEAAVDTGLALEVDKKQIHIEDAATDNGETSDIRHFEKPELHQARLLEDTTELSKCASGQYEGDGLKVETHESSPESHIISSWKLIDGRDASDSDSDSDHAESSSPDASMADIIPMLDELHPLLDSEDPQPVTAPVDDVHSLSGASTEDGESNDGSGEEEAENQGEGGEEEQEAKEDNEDGAALAVKWTEDDEKNLLVLGTSELERNLRLENLIAKRRARKNLRVEAERNLIDLDGGETVSIMDELSRFQMPIPAISTARRNPFDLPYDSEENIGLPPIPGSAPSVLLPRRNPFDLPQDQAAESGSLTGVCQSHQGFVTVPQREMFFTRHESFALGASFTGELKQEKHDSRFRPYFVAERTNLEDTSYAHFQRQLSEMSDSKVSSIPESESISSIVDQDYRNEVLQQQLHRESEFQLVSSSTNDVKHFEKESSSFDQVDLVDPLCRHSEVNICNNHEVDVSTYEVAGASMHEPVNDFLKHEEQSRHDQDLCCPISDVAKSDVSEDRSSSSCSSEVSEKNFSTKTEEGSADLQQSGGDSSQGSSGSVQSLSGEVEVVNDYHVVEPVYDSSPSALEKSLSNIASLEEVLHGRKGSFKSASSQSSETLVETSEMGSSPMVSERNIFSDIPDSVSGAGSMGGISASDSGTLWMAPSNLSFVEENESRSREVGEIREQDVIQVNFSEVNDDYDHPTASMSALVTEQIMSYSSSTDTETETETDPSEDSTGDIGEFSEHEKIVVAAPHSDVAVSHYFNSQTSPNAQPLVESSKIQVEGMELSFLSERTEIHEAELSSTCSADSKHGLSKHEISLSGHINASDAVCVSIEETKMIDDEALLLELDAIGDFRVESITETSAIHMGECPKMMETENKSDLEEVEARSIQDIDIALKNACDGTLRNLEPSSILEVQASERFELTGTVCGRETDQIPHGSSASSSASSNQKKEESHESDSSSSSSSSDSD